MIRAEFFVSEGELVGFHISGHAGYDDAGKDILCAFVSSAAYMTVNTITEIVKVPAKAEAEDGDMVLSLDKHDAAKCRDHLKGLMLHLKNTEEQYPEYLTVKTTEV